MKRKCLSVGLLAVFAASSFFIVSCNKKSPKVSYGYKTSSSTAAVNSKANAVPEELKYVSGSSKHRALVGDAFVLDYSVQIPEEESVPKKISTKVNSSKKSDKKEKSQNVEQMKDISSYSTKYNTKRFSYSEIASKIQKGENTKTSVKELKVIEWGPENTIISEMDKPVFFVIFSEPVKELTALSDSFNKSDVFSISPEVEGTFHWRGTNHLTFECEKNSVLPGIEYKLTVNKNLKALSGHKITGDLEFYTKAQNLQLTAIPEIAEKNARYGKNSEFTPEQAANLIVTSSWPLSIEEIKRVLYFRIGNDSKPLSYTVKAAGEITSEKTTKFAVHINDKLPVDSKILYSNCISLKADEFTYTNPKVIQTIKPLIVTYSDRQVRNGSESKKNLLQIRFNHDVDPDTLNNITIDYLKNLDDSFSSEYKDSLYKVEKENMELRGNTLYIFNINFEAFGAYYRILIRDVKDVYGQKLFNTECKFALPRAASFFDLCDTGSKMLEAQFPHRLAYAYQNLNEGSWWQISKAKNPLYRYSWNHHSNKKDDAKEFDVTHENMQVMDYVELEELLDDGYGWIDFTAQYIHDSYNRWNDEMETNEDESHLLVQVTDLGVTARVGINRAVVMVRTLSKDEAVANAKVAIYRNDSEHYVEQFSSDRKFWVEGVTDKNGFAVIEIPEEDAKWIESKTSDLAVYVESGKDRATFYPKGHNWNYGLDEARNIYKRVFMFTDRKLYKPGETVTFRGIDKNQHMGRFTSYVGKYKIEVAGSSWNDKTVYYKEEGTTSKSGGFYGSFQLPADLEPAYYSIKYYREGNDDWNWVDSEYIDVRYFEPTKLQTEVEIPDVTYYGGASVSVGIRGIYLAGGAIADGLLETSWYSEPAYFSCSMPEAKRYHFGPEDWYGGRRYLSENVSNLDGDGSATVSIVTEKIKDGLPRTYILESGITDVSNEKTNTQAKVTVHPARFYIGVGTPFVKGFPEKGKKIDFSYLLITPEQQFATTKMVSGELTYKLDYITWELSNSNGIDDEIYSSYHKVERTVKQGKLPADVKGSFSYVPEKSGEYKLCIEGFDSNGNKAVTEFEFYVTGSDSYWFSPNSSGKIDLVPDQSMYNPGDTAKILMKSSLPAGDYLITVEREGIYTQEIKHFDSPSSVIEIPVAGNYLPYAYVCVASYSKRTKQPTHKFGEKDMDKPASYFGSTKINVNPYIRAFSVDVQTDKTIYRPGDEATVTLKATKGGKPLENAELTVMGVDRAVVDLINYHVPNPIEYFYRDWNFHHCVTGGDSRNMLMDPVTYAIKNLQGGDADEDKENQRKDFRPTAFFEPAVKTDKNGIATVTFKVPSQLTTFRVTAFGVNGELFALQEDEFGVRNPVNVQAVQPRLLRVRDTAECGVVLTNLGNEKVTVNVSLEVRKPEEDSEKDIEEGYVTVAGHAFVDGNSQKSVTVEAGESTVAYFTIAAAQAGTVELVYKIDSEVLKETLFSPMKIEKTFTYETTSLSGVTTDGKNSVSEEQIVIPGFAEEGEGSVTVTLDATRLGILNSAIKYVFDYPYGCLEQRTSKVLPLLIFEDYIKVFGLDSVVRNPKNVVKNHFKYVAKYQHKDGGFGYWPESLDSNLYVSSRILELCYLALDRNYSRSTIAVDLSSLERFVLNESKKTKYAYGLYVISQRDQYQYADVANQIYDEVKAADKNLDALAMAGLTAMNHNKARALLMRDFIKTHLQADSRSATVYKLHYDNEALAHTLKLFALIDKDDPMVDRLLYKLLVSLKNGYWSNTRQTAAALDAVYTYIKVRNLDDVSFKAHVELAGINVASGQFKGAGAEPVRETVSFKEELKNLPRDKALNLKFEKEGKGILYYSALLTYALPDELQNSRAEGVNIDYEIFDVSSDSKLEPEKDSKVMTLESGKTYRAKITITSNEDLYMLALRTPVPSGAAILDAHFANQSINSRIKKTGSEWKRRIISEALYDNEGHFFWDSFARGAYTLEFQFRANRRGIYPCPPVQAECMYEPEIFGRSDGYLFVIK